MSEAACFRCDWQGKTTSRACPNCGAPLFRSETPRVRAPAEERRSGGSRPPGRSRPPGGSRPTPEPSPDEREPTQRTAPWRVLVGMAAAVLLLAVVFTRIPNHGTVGAPSSSSPSPPARFAQGHGSLVYTTTVGPGPVQAVARFDLARGVTTLGPKIPPAEDLVDASGVGLGWLGLTAPTKGALGAYLLHGTSPSSKSVRIGTGDLVAWGPNATSVAFASRGPVRHGCREVRIDVANVLTDITEAVLDEPKVCGDILALGRSGSATYFTQSSRGRLAVYFTGVAGVPHPLLDGYGMLSVSPESDFLVAPERGIPGPPGVGALLFWRGQGGPVRIGTAGFPLVVERVLAWSPDGAQAAVVGRLAFREGVFVLDAGPGVGRREPTFVGPGGDGLDATFDDQGVLYLVINGHLFSYVDGSLADVLLPAGSPAPGGSIVWTP